MVNNLNTIHVTVQTAEQYTECKYGGPLGRRLGLVSKQRDKTEQIDDDDAGDVF